MSKISLQMFTMREYTKTKEELRNTLQTLAGYGFRNVQYSVPDFLTPREVKELLDEAGLRNDSAYHPNIFTMEQEMDKVMEQLEVFDTPYLRISTLPFEMLNPEGIRKFTDAVNRIGRILAPQGIKLLYHFHSYEFFKVEGETVMETMLRQTSPECMQLMPDTYWIIDGGLEPMEFLARHRDRIEYVHTKDYAIENPQPGWNWERRFAPVGTGNLNWDGILDVCEDMGAAMYIIEQDQSYGRDIFQCVKSSIDFLKRKGID